MNENTIITKNDSPPTPVKKNKNLDISIKNEPISRNENTIDTNEFEKIDKQYEKKEGVLAHLFSKKNKELKETPHRSESIADSETQKLKKQLDDFSFKLDKIDGRLEAEVGSREAINERLSTFAEEIGELRSMILDRERSFNEIQTGFEQIEENTKALHPKKIQADFEKMEKLITDNTIKVEKTELFLNSAKEELQKYRTQMNKIKSFDNLSNSIEKLKEELDQITDTKNYIDRKAAKVETIFSDLNDRLKDFNKEKVVIEKVDELTRDLLKSIDSIELKLEESALKEDIDKKLIPVTNSLNENSKNITAILNTIQNHTQKLQFFKPEEIETMQKDFVGIERILDSLERRYTNSIKETDTKLNAMMESKKDIEEFKNPIELKTNTTEIAQKINNLEQSILVISNKLTELSNIPTTQQNPANTISQESILTLKNKIDYIAANIPSINEKILEQKQLTDSYTKKIELFEKLNSNNEKTMRFLTTMIEQTYQNSNRSNIKSPEIQKTSHSDSFKTEQTINTNKTTIEKTKKQKIILTDKELEIAKQLIIANNMLSEFDLNAAEKQCNKIKNIIHPQIKNSTPSKNISYLNEILKDLDDFLTIPEKTADNFKKNMQILKEIVYDNTNTT